MKSKIRESTVVKMLNVLKELQRKLYHTHHIKLGKFCNDNGVSGSTGRILRDKGIILAVSKSPNGAIDYKWDTKDPDMMMARAVVEEANRLNKAQAAVREAKKYTEKLKQRDEEEIAKLEEVKEEPKYPIFTKSSTEPVASIKVVESKQDDDLTLIRVTEHKQVIRYFFSWLKITKAIKFETYE